jgi:sortase (surface protein transpeptidase)
MENNPELQPKMRATRHNLLVMAFAVVIGISLGFALDYYFSKDTEEYVQEPPRVEATTTSQFARSAPSELRIPKLNLTTTFEAPLGLKEDRTIEVPDSYTQVGWYENGPTPGEIGPAVVLGHVDSYEGPAVFWPLGKLEPGDEVEIEREDGTTAVFVITKLERYSQDDFPTELVYGPIDHAGLRLITCSGTYLKGVQRYTHNLVVYAELKEPVE